MGVPLSAILAFEEKCLAHGDDVVLQDCWSLWGYEIAPHWIELVFNVSATVGRFRNWLLTLFLLLVVGRLLQETSSCVD